MINHYDGTNDLIKITKDDDSETYFKIDATGANYELGLTGSTINIKGAAYRPPTGASRTMSPIWMMRPPRSRSCARALQLEGGAGRGRNQERFLGFLAGSNGAGAREHGRRGDDPSHVGVVPVLVEALKESGAWAIAGRLDVGARSALRIPCKLAKSDI